MKDFTPPKYGSVNENVMDAQLDAKWPARLVKVRGYRNNPTYLLFLPLRESAADEAAFCVNVVMSAEDDE